MILYCISRATSSTLVLTDHPFSAKTTTMIKILTSTEDRSVNFVRPSNQESRYVRREDDYFIVYLSSHNGCNKACRFCHLTQTKQTDMVEASVDEMLFQAASVIEHYEKMVRDRKEPEANRIHFNWMARGDALASSVILTKWAELTRGLRELAAGSGIVDVQFNISSIFPKEEMSEVIDDRYFEKIYDAFYSKEIEDSKNMPVFYYSLYSMREQFRKRWLPKAADPRLILDALTKWQNRTGQPVVLHWAMIEGENDSAMDVAGIAGAIRFFGLKAKFNLVRYNPYSVMLGHEPAEAIIQRRFDEMVLEMKAPGSRIVPRVGRDVFASCGTFVTK